MKWMLKVLFVIIFLYLLIWKKATCNAAAYLKPGTLEGALVGCLAALGTCCLTCAAFLAVAALVAAAGFLVFTLAFLTSLAARIACSRWALRTSGFWLRFFMISSRVAPAIARWNLAALWDFFFASSSTWPFLCLRR